jgi:hypothetical protein
LLRQSHETRGWRSCDERKRWEVGENYEAVREINDKRHSDKRWSCEEWGRVWWGEGLTVTPNVYISHHGVNDVQRLADKTNPPLGPEPVGEKKIPLLPPVLFIGITEF